MNKERRLRQKIDELEQRWKLLNEKLSRLREAKTIETDAARIFELEKKIEPLETEFKTIEGQLDDLENQLSPEREINTGGLQDKTRVQPAPKIGNGAMKLSAELNKKIVVVPAYKYDIAVSYAHIDDQPSYGAEEGWVITLIKTLKIQLAQKLGSEDAYTLWSDHQLPGNVPISEMITIFRDSALLIVVLSPGYVMSEWCQRQQNNFLSDVQNRVRSGSRVFVVERDHIEAGDRPSEFRDLRGYQFWVRDREGKPPRVLTPQRDADPYYDMLNDLSYDLAQELRKLRSQK